jgi:hypothetical protein
MDDHFKIYRMLRYLPWIAVGMILLLITALRLSMLQMPLERDEGEYAYMGQLLLQGIPPYLMAYSMKLPGMFAIYALIMGIFGQSVSAIHLGLLIFNGLAIVLVFLLTRYLVDDVAGVVAALVYGLLSVSPSVLGTAAHATQFLVPFTLCGLFLLLKAIDQRRNWMLIASGLLLGMAFLVKQHAAFFVLFAVIYCFRRLKNMPLTMKEAVYKTSILIVSSMIPFLATCGLLYRAGVFPTFWFWTFSYASQYASYIPVSLASTIFMIFGWPAIDPWRLIWIIAGIGLSAFFWNKKIRVHWDFCVGLSIFSFLTICPGFHFRDHYFITLLPAVSMLSGIAVSTSMIYLSQRFSPYFKAIPVIFIVVALGLPTLQQAGYFRANLMKASRMIYLSNPFMESLAIAKYIKNHSSEADTIAVIGSEPQIYFYANRKSATGYIYMYGLMEPQVYAYQMQKEMIREIESMKPRYVVFVSSRVSWQSTTKSNLHIIDWAGKYLKDYYCLRAVINSDSILKTNVNPQNIESICNYSLSVLERRQ